MARPLTAAWAVTDAARDCTRTRERRAAQEDPHCRRAQQTEQKPPLASRAERHRLRTLERRRGEEPSSGGAAADALEEPDHDLRSSRRARLFLLLADAHGRGQAHRLAHR